MATGLQWLINRVGVDTVGVNPNRGLVLQWLINRVGVDTEKEYYRAGGYFNGAVHIDQISA